MFDKQKIRNLWVDKERFWCLCHNSANNHPKAPMPVSSTAAEWTHEIHSVNVLLQACINPCKTDWKDLEVDAICRFRRDIKNSVVWFSKRKCLTLTGREQKEDDEKVTELERCIKQLDQWSALFSVRKITRGGKTLATHDLGVRAVLLQKLYDGVPLSLSSSILLSPSQGDQNSGICPDAWFRHHIVKHLYSHSRVSSTESLTSQIWVGGTAGSKVLWVFPTLLWFVALKKAQTTGPAAWYPAPTPSTFSSSSFSRPVSLDSHWTVAEHQSFPLPTL